MRIPIGNFGNAVAQPQQQAQAPGSDGIGQAISRVGQAASGVADSLIQAEQQKQRAQAASTLATLTNDMHDIHDEIGRGVSDGKVAPGEAIPEYKKRIGGITAERTQGLTAEQRLLIDDNIIKASGTLERSLNGVAIKRTQADTGANLMTMGEAFQRNAMRDLPGSIVQWDKSVDAMGPQAGWDPTKIADVKQKFREGATYNFANATLEGAAQTGSIDLIRAARGKIEGADGEPIDPAKRTALIVKAYAYENGILAQNRRDAEKASREQLARENAAIDIYNKAFDLSSQGRYFSTDFINELTAGTAGTKMAGQVLELVKSQAKVAGFASLSLTNQQAELERMRAAGSDPKIGVDPVEQNVQNQFSRIHEASTKAYAENPWQAAQERGVIKDAPVIQLNNVQDAQQVLGQRMQQIGQVEVAAGRKVSPLQPQEAETIGRLVRMLPPDQQSSALAGFGATLGDADRVAALAHQIDKKDKVLGTAMMYANLQTTQGRYVSELIIKGDRALRDKSVMVDSAKETGWRGAIAKEIGDAFPNQEVRDKMIDAAYLVTAGMAAEGSPDVSRAVRMAAGRIIEQRDGSKIPLPYGMEEGDFEKRLKAVQSTDLAGQAPGGQVYIGKNAVPLEQFVKGLPDASLVHAGQGRYNVRAGMGLVTNQQGKRITIEVRNAR
jgi:hypothetical protein